MRFYYFMMKRLRPNYQQAKCVLTYFMLLLPTAAFTVAIRNASSIVFHSLLLLTGWCTWTFVEYILHRFWMHDKAGRSPMARVHANHHKHPTELVVTNFHRIAMIAVLAVLVFVAGRLDNYFTLLVGFCFGIEGYFLVHRLIHLRAGEKLFKKLVRYHIYHHCKYTSTCYGVSVPWWDDLFGTVPPAPILSSRIINFYFKGKEPGDASLIEPATERGAINGITKTCNRNCHSCCSDRRGLFTK